MNTVLKQVVHIATLAAASGSMLAHSAPSLADQARIVGGSNISINSAPATVAMLSNRLIAQTGSYFQAQFCGATVIADRWVLTAAHCVVHEGSTAPASGMSILMGSTDLESPTNQPVGVSRVIPHRGYDPRTMENDIALLELEYDSLVPAATLDMQTITLNDDALIAGWGAINDSSDPQGQKFPTHLQGALVNMIPGGQCADLFPRYANEVGARQLCAGVRQGGIDSCQGDSGGPLYRYNNESMTLTVTGVTSWGYGCADAEAPGVYTRVGAYTDWMMQNTGISISTSTNEGQLQQNDDPGPIINNESNIGGTVNSNGNTNTVNSPFASSASAGAGGYGMLLLIGLWGVFRGRRFQVLATVSLISLISTACSLSQAKQDEDLESTESSAPQQHSAVILSALPIGEPRDQVIEQASVDWGDNPACTLIRVALNHSRRAFFLESCVFAHPVNSRICNAAPATVNYHFLEGVFVQLAIEYDTLENPAHYQQCVQNEKNLLTKARISEVTVDPSYRTTVTQSDQAHNIRKVIRHP